MLQSSSLWPVQMPTAAPVKANMRDSANAEQKTFPPAFKPRQAQQNSPPPSVNPLLYFGKKLKILITAGGTKEDIDTVRFITNFSTGSLGRAFSVEAAKRGHEVTLLAPKELPLMTGPLPESVIHQPFRSTADLQQALKTAAESQKWDVVIHSAAVSDYKPEAQAGKISSDKDELVIRMVKTPKLINSFREWFGRAFLVGFKLLSGTPPKERHKIALAQIKKNRTNLCVENDLTEVSSKSHKARLVTPEGGAVPVPVGDKAQVASSILDFIEKRQKVRWFQTLQDPSLPQTTSSPIPGQLLKLAQEMNLLVDENGNMSVKLPNGLIAMTPRGVNKAAIGPQDFMIIKVNQKTRKVYVNHPRKPSIDSSVSDALYKAFPKMTATIHTHSPWGVGAVKTGFPYPCGVKEESIELIRALKQSGYQDGKPFLANMSHHGLILGLSGALTADRLAQQAKTVQADFKSHMAEIGATEEELAGGKLETILAPEGIVGYVYRFADNSVAPRLLPEHQGKGYGPDIINTLRETDTIVKTVPDCKVLEYYKRKGFEEIKNDGRLSWLKPTPIAS